MCTVMSRVQVVIVKRPEVGSFGKNKGTQNQQSITFVIITVLPSAVMSFMLLQIM